jgi:hypothetical protein
VTVIVDDFYGALKGIAEQLSPGFGASRRDCGTGAGGFKPGNKCAGGGGGGSGGGANAFSKWRESNGKTLDRVRAEIAEGRKLADELIADQESRRSAAYDSAEKAREGNDSIREQLKPVRERLRDALVDGAKTQEEKDRWKKENLILLHSSIRPKEIEGNGAALEALNEIKSLQARRDKALSAIMEHEVEMEKASQFIQRVRADSAKEAWARIGAQAKEFALDDSGNGLGYKPDAYDNGRARFAESLKETTVVHNSGSRQEFDVVKKDIDQFVTSAISPVSWAGDAVKSARVVLDEKNERAYCSVVELHLHPSGNATTYAHELGHVLESKPTIRRAAVEFHAARCRPEDEVSIRDKYPDSGYHPSERGNPDKFADAIKAVYGENEFSDSQLRAHYVGKVYRDGSGNVGATEVVSMGLQMMHDNPAAFASADPEYFDFMVAVMTGAETRFPRRGGK